MKHIIATSLVILGLTAGTRGDDGSRADPPAQRTVLAERLEVPPTKEHSLTFRMPSPAGGREPYLFFKAAAQSGKAGGYCNRAIRVLVNAAPVDSERLCNRAATATSTAARPT